jgi:aminomethyltransferase
MAMSDYFFPNFNCKKVEIDGVSVPEVFSTIDKEVGAVRHSVGISDISCVSVLRISGEHAYELTDRICPCFLHIRVNQMKHTILLKENGSPLADIYICKEQSGYVILGKGMPHEALSKYIYEHKKPDENITVEILNTTHSLLSLNGPFAWEALSELEEPEVISLPYLSFYYPDINSMIFRAGETGEFGYLLLLPKEHVDMFCKKIIEIQDEFDIEFVGFAALQYCYLENMFFNIFKEGAVQATPAELQLQWRVSYLKRSLHFIVLNDIKSRPLTRRLTGVLSERPFRYNDEVFCDNKKIGFIINASRFISGNGSIGLAMLDMPYAVSGISCYEVLSQGDKAPLKTVSPPFIRNRSLCVDPQIHAYQERETISFPPITGK